MVRICIWGDSIARGAFDKEMGGWVNRLRHYFDNRSDDISIYNLAISGDHSDDLMKRFKVECIAREPEVIIFAIGINDSAYINNNKENPQVSLEKYEENLQDLINIAKKYSEKIVFIGLTKVIEEKTMPFPRILIVYYDNENVKIYDNKLKEVVNENNLPYIYMFDLIEDSELEDGLHPNAVGHEKIFQRVKTFLIKNILK